MTVLARLAPASLSGRLVATVVTLVALVSLLVAVITTVAMHSYLTDRLDGQVDEALARAVGAFERGPGLPPDSPDEPHDEIHGEERGEGPEVRIPIGQGVGTLTAYFLPSGRGGDTITASSGRQPLSTAALNSLADVPADGERHVVDLPGLGSYRIKAYDGGTATVVAGLPTAGDDDTLASLVGWELLLLVSGVALAAVAGQLLVRRQLRPLREVAATAHEVTELPLSSGEIGMTVRVPDRLTDPRTEVGQVGAALNKMLGHVERALDARHNSEQQVRRFVADASHELRTPLSTIHGYAELSRRTGPVDALQLSHAMTKVEAEATRMSSLVEDLLLLARLDAGRPLERREVDVTKLVLEAVDDARVLGPDHRWVLELPDQPVTVVGDEQRLHQVVTNLLNNARLHTPAGTTVTVSTRALSTRALSTRALSTQALSTQAVDGDPVSVAPARSEVLVQVRDDGPGLPDSLTHSVFERFSRGDSARTRASGGAGLGLSLVWAIAAAHGGRVDVRSERGSTAFEVHLPVVGPS